MNPQPYRPFIVHQPEIRGNGPVESSSDAGGSTSTIDVDVSSNAGNVDDAGNVDSYSYSYSVVDVDVSSIAGKFPAMLETSTT
jgi:hypothetical protein